MTRTFSGCVLAAALLLTACSEPAPTFKGSDVTGIGWGGDIAMQGHTGEPVSTADFKGRIAIVFFGYSHCPDICSPTLAKLAQLREALGERARQVQVVFVTVDPERDTPAQLTAFLARFDSSFVGLTGSPADIERAVQEYRVERAATSAGHTHQPQIGHSGRMFVKDREGQLRLVWANEIPVADMVHDVNLLLAQAG